ncbi:MAG: hypothetical protein ACFNTB_02630, partial [Prevotella denticola]
QKCVMIDPCTEEIEDYDGSNSRQKPDNAGPKDMGRQKVSPSYIPIGQDEQQEKKQYGQQLFLESSSH